jgi:hypothetical protein
MSRPPWMNRQYSGSDASHERRDADIVAKMDKLAERVAALEGDANRHHALARGTARIFRAHLRELVGSDHDAIDMHDLLTEFDGAPVVALHPNQAAEDTRPAWQRAEVGDRVSVRMDGFEPDTGIVVDVGGEPDYRLKLERPYGTNWTSNDRILSILPPEPERPIDRVEAANEAWRKAGGRLLGSEPGRQKDETAAEGGFVTLCNFGSGKFAQVIQRWVSEPQENFVLAPLRVQGANFDRLHRLLIEEGMMPETERPKDETALMCQTSTCPNYGSACFEECPDWPKAAPSTSLGALKADEITYCGGIWRAIHKWHRAKDGSPALAAADEIDAALSSLLDRAHALGLSERVQTDAGDVRERAIGLLQCPNVAGGHIEIYEAVAAEYVDRLASAGLLASQPQTVTVNWNEALTRYYATARAPHGTASDALLAVLRSIPNLVIEGEP